MRTSIRILHESGTLYISIEGVGIAVIFYKKKESGILRMVPIYLYTVYKHCVSRICPSRCKRVTVAISSVARQQDITTLSVHEERPDVQRVHRSMAGVRTAAARTMTVKTMSSVAHLPRSI